MHLECLIDKSNSQFGTGEDEVVLIVFIRENETRIFQNVVR